MIPLHRGLATRETEMKDDTKLRKAALWAASMLLIALMATSCNLFSSWFDSTAGQGPSEDTSEAVGELTETRNGNKAYFNANEIAYAEGKGHFIELSPLDDKGRVGECWGLFDYSHMPTYDREDLDTNPTGWHQNHYDSSIVPGGWIYARAHLLGFQLSGLQDNPQNLMTGTRDLNNEGMLPYENMAADHLQEERSHRILYRVTPDFGEDNLLAYGILMESDCLDCDDSADFCVYVRNQQPGITIDYGTGRNWQSGAEIESEDPSTLPGAEDYVVNTSTNTFHLPSCRYAEGMNQANRLDIKAPKDWMTAHGYDPCGICNP